MQAYLWDGSKQIKGQLSIKEGCLTFDLDDFEATDLHLSIPLSDIVSTCRKPLYGLAPQLVEVKTSAGTCNAFVMEEERDAVWLMGVGG